MVKDDEAQVQAPDWKSRIDSIDLNSGGSKSQAPVTTGKKAAGTCPVCGSALCNDLVMCLRKQIPAFADLADLFTVTNVTVAINVTGATNAGAASPAPPSSTILAGRSHPTWEQLSFLAGW